MIRLALAIDGCGCGDQHHRHRHPGSQLRGTAGGHFPKPEHHRPEAACSWVVDCRPS
jgi:hypothetical protein